MTQHQLDRAIASATGESPRTIHRMGFGPLGERPGDLEPEDLALAVDCPFCRRPTRLPGSGSGLPAMAECDPCDIDFEFGSHEVYAAAVGELASASPVAA